MQTNRDTIPVSPQLPHHVTSVDQKIFEEYARTHPIDPSSIHGNFVERTISGAVDLWRSNKKLFIPLSSGLLVLLVGLPIAILSMQDTRSVVEDKDKDAVTVSYYAEEASDPDRSNSSVDTTSGSVTIPSPSDTLPGSQKTILGNPAPAAAIGSDDDTEYMPAEPVEPGGPVEEPVAPVDPPESPPPVIPDTPTGTVASVSIVSFNYAHWKPSSGINDAVRNLSDKADVIGFQEFGPKAHREALSQVVKNCTACGYALYMPDVSNGGNIPIIWKKSKFTVVSKGNMKVYNAQRVEDGAGGPDVTAKHITWVRLKDKTSGRVFVAMNSHLIPSVESDGQPNRNKPQRLALYDKHISALANKASQFKNSGSAVFLTGDFNVNHRRDSAVKAPIFPYAKMGTVGMWSNWRLLGVLEGGTHGTGNRLIDYVFVSRGTNTPPVSHRILAKNGSDHHPVLTTIELRKK